MKVDAVLEFGAWGPTELPVTKLKLHALFLAKLSKSEPPNETLPRIGDVLTVYHPQSKRQSAVETCEDFVRRNTDRPPTDPEFLSRKPWKPFASRIDFEFAEVATEAHLSKSVVERLISIVSRAAKGNSGFSLASYADLEASWEKASRICTTVSTQLGTDCEVGND